MDRDAPEGFPATGLTRVGAPCPPKLEEALGYEGGLGYVAFYWEPAGDELRWCDGVVDTEGSWHAWLAFVGHPAVEPHLRPFEFGNSETPSAHWLLLDRGRRALYAGSPEVVAGFLRASLPPEVLAAGEETLRALAEGADDLEEALGSLAEGFRLVEPADPDELLAAVRRRLIREAALVDRLRRWLDGQPAAPSASGDGPGRGEKSPPPAGRASR